MIAVLFGVAFWGASATLVTAKYKPHRVYAAMHREKVARQARQDAIKKTQQGIQFYIDRTHDWQDLVLSPRTRSENAATHTKSLRYTRWILRLWQKRSAKARQFAETYPWARMVKRTYPYLQCIIDTESRSAGIYNAQNRYSTASGAYQFIDGTWQSSVRDFDAYFHVHITNAQRAIDAPPAVQDAVAAYEVAANYGNPWQECRGEQRLAPPGKSVKSNKMLFIPKEQV